MVARWVMIAAISVVGLAGCVEPDWSRDCKRESWSRGDEIVGALNAYRAKNGEFPANLELLVPEYLKEIREPTCDNDSGWAYENLGECFSLQFWWGKNRYPRCWYEGGQWRMDV